MKEIEIPISEGYEARIEGNKVIMVPKESEDEKIRKELYEFIKVNSPTEDANRFIAWLEKQKEQIIIKQNIIDSIRANTQPDWDFSTIPNLHKEINRFFGEKFVLPHTENTVITVSDVIRCAYHFYKFGQQEQKPAEYPEKGNEYWFGFNEGKGVVLDNPEQFGLYKPAEWSEEDEKLLDAMIDMATNSLYEPLCPRGKMIVWLKSLRPQNHWKPTEEQMRALRFVIENIDASILNPELLQTLVILENNLKAL